MLNQHVYIYMSLLSHEQPEDCLFVENESSPPLHTWCHWTWAEASLSLSLHFSLSLYLRTNAYLLNLPGSIGLEPERLLAGAITLLLTSSSSASWTNVCCNNLDDVEDVVMVAGRKQFFLSWTSVESDTILKFGFILKFCIWRGKDVRSGGCVICKILIRFWERLRETGS